MARLAHSQRNLQSVFNERNRIHCTETTPVAIAHPSAPMFMFLAPTEYTSRCMWYTWFISSNAKHGSSNSNYLLHDSIGFPMLRMMLGVYSWGYGSLTQMDMVSGSATIQPGFLISFVSWWAKVKLGEQRLQIMWQLQMGSKITPTVPKWLAGIICNDIWQSSPLPQDRTTELNHCKEEAICARTVFYFVKQVYECWSITNEGIQICVHTIAHQEDFRNAVVIVLLCIWDSENWFSYWRMDLLGTLRRPTDSACINEIQLRCHIPMQDWMLSVCHTVQIGNDNYVIHQASWNVHIVAATVDTMFELETNLSCSHTRPEIPPSPCNEFDHWHCNSRVSKSGGTATGRASGIARECIWITATEEPHSNGHCTFHITILLTTAVNHLLASEEVGWTIGLGVGNCSWPLEATMERIPNDECNRPHMLDVLAGSYRCSAEKKNPILCWIDDWWQAEIWMETPESGT